MQAHAGLAGLQRARPRDAQHALLTAPAGEHASGNLRGAGAVLRKDARQRAVLPRHGKHEAECRQDLDTVRQPEGAVQVVHHLAEPAAQRPARPLDLHHDRPGSPAGIQASARREHDHVGPHAARRLARRPERAACNLPKDPEEPRNYFDLAQIMYKQKYRDSIANMLKCAIELKQKDFWGYWGLGIFQFKQNNYKDADFNLNAALRIVQQLEISQPGKLKRELFLIKEDIKKLNVNKVKHQASTHQQIDLF